MADISGGSLYFTAELNNDQLDAAIEETLRKVQGLSSGFTDTGDTIDTVAAQMAESIMQQREVIQSLESQYTSLQSQLAGMQSGDGQTALTQQASALRAELSEERTALTVLEQSFQTLTSTAASCAEGISQIQKTLIAIGEACAQNEDAVSALEAEYQKLQSTFRGNVSLSEKEVGQIKARMQAIQGEIQVRKTLLSDLRGQSDALQESADALSNHQKKVEGTTLSTASYRTQIRALQEELVRLEAAGQRNTSTYSEVQEQVARLTDAWNDARTQARLMANDQAGFLGVINGLTGLSGGISAAVGMMGLFGTETKELQTLMLRTQSIMAVTNGLMQVSQTLNKDSAFMLNTVGKLQKWWNGIKAAGTSVLTTNTVAERANTSATAANATAATAGATANVTLAGAFRMVGAAIKSIPVFGWIAAAISGLVAVITSFSAKARAAKKDAEEFGAALSEACYEPIGKTLELTNRWNALGDSIAAKTKFIEDNREAFDSLGVSIKGVSDAENLLVANTQAYIDAQVARAKATLNLQQASEKLKEYIANQSKLEGMSDTIIQTSGGGMFGGAVSYETENAAKKRLQERNDSLLEEIMGFYTKAAQAESEGLHALQEAGLSGIEAYAEGTLGAIEEAISAKEALLKNISDPKEYQEALAEIAKLQAQADAITGGGSKSSADSIASARASIQQAITNAVIDAMADGTEKELAQIEQRRQAELSAVEKEKTDLEAAAKAAGGSLTTSDYDAYKTRIRQINDKYDALITATEEKRAAYVKGLYSDVADVFLTEEERKASAITQKYASLRKQASASLASGDLSSSDYEALLGEYDRAEAKETTDYWVSLYGDYEQRKAALMEEWEKKIASIPAEYQEQATKEMSNEVIALYTSMSKDYALLSTDLANATVSKVKSAVQAIRVQLAKLRDEGQITQEEYEAQIQAVSNKLESAIGSGGGGVFSSLWGNSKGSSLMDFFFGGGDFVTKINDVSTAFSSISNDAASASGSTGEISEGIAAAGGGAATALAGVDAIITAVYQTLSSVSDTLRTFSDMYESFGESDKADTLNTWAEGIDTINERAMSGWENLKSGNIAGAISDTIGGVVDMITFANTVFDKKYTKAIEKHQDAVEELQRAYSKLEYAIDNALGIEYYSLTQQSISNLEEQKAELEEMIRLEEKKKKTDDDKIQDYEDQITEIEETIQDLYDEISEELLQTTATDFATDLADALVSAFEAGEDAAEAFEETVNTVLKNAIVNMLKKKFLEEQLQEALDDLEDSMGYWDGDDFIFDGLTDDEIASFKAKVQAAADNFNEALEVYKDLFEDLEDDSDDALSGAVKGVTEETAEILAGQLNAMRITQSEMATLMQQQLQALNTIAAYAKYQSYLTRLDTIVSLLGDSTVSALRAKGLST